MNILIFGASGYIGQRVTRRLLDVGHAVTGFVRNDQSAEKVRSLGAEAHIGSLDDSDMTGEAISRCEGIVWLVQLTLEEEKRVVGNLLRQLKGSDKFFVFVGGASVLSIPTGGDWIDNSFSEFDSFIPRRPLAIRAETELMVRTASQSGVRSIVVRPPLVFGHGGCKVISDIYHSARKTGAVCYVGRGLNAYSSVHVDDLAQLLALVFERGVSGSLYHCVSAESTFRSMAEAIARHLGLETRSVSIDEAKEIWDPFSATTVFSSSSRVRSPLARAALGWVPTAERSDILEECLHPAYAAETHRDEASWVKPSKASG